jgi:uncharacterized glyoxalase superfamily protein PhnB
MSAELAQAGAHDIGTGAAQQPLRLRMRAFPDRRGGGQRRVPRRRHDHPAAALIFPVDLHLDQARLFNGLADSGQVTMPMGKTFFSPKFGMLADKFGVGWMVLVAD